MTDTDKLKRLAERMVGNNFATGLTFTSSGSVDYGQAILALIAENEALNGYGKSAAKEAVRYRKERDEAVALLRECLNQPMEPWGKVSEFLARIDGGV